MELAELVMISGCTGASLPEVLHELLLIHGKWSTEDRHAAMVRLCSVSYATIQCSLIMSVIWWSRKFCETLCFIAHVHMFLDMYYCP